MKLKNNRFLSRNIILIVFALLSAVAHAEDAKFLLSEEQWARPRSASVVKSFEPVNQTLKAWLKDTKKQQIELRYPGGEDGNLWAIELQDWLVALGIPSERINIYPGHPVQGELALIVLPR